MSINGEQVIPDELFAMTSNADGTKLPLRALNDQQLIEALEGFRQGEAQITAQIAAQQQQQRFVGQVIAVILYEQERRKKTGGIIIPDRNYPHAK